MEAPLEWVAGLDRRVRTAWVELIQAIKEKGARVALNRGSRRMGSPYGAVVRR